MLYIFPELPRHPVYRLNKHLRFFFRKISNAGSVAVFDTRIYFHSEFALWLEQLDQTTLKSHFENFFYIYTNLSRTQKQQLLKRFSDAQSINSILEDINFNGRQIQSSSIPLIIRPATKTLFSYLYKITLKSFGKVKDHYKELYKKLDNKICPFCGIEKLNPPSLRKQDYDHILIQSKYLYSTINMKNLVPMGTECNRNYKGTKDVIYNRNSRVIYYSPFLIHYPITITLTGSIPPANFKSGGNWAIQINPDNPYTRRWAEVFQIKKRYSDQMLDGCFLDWIKEYKSYVKVHGVPTNATEIQDNFKRLGNMLLDNPLSDPNLVKGAFYDFLSTYKDETFNQAVLAFVTK